MLLYIWAMFIREKKNKSGVVSVQIIDKGSGRYKVIKTIGSSSIPKEVASLVLEGNRYIQTAKRALEFDFQDYRTLYGQVLSSISNHRQVGIRLVLGSIFDQIGFNAIEDELFKDLVLYRLVYPKSKLKTTEYLYRYEQRVYSEDDIYRYMDKLHSKQKDLIQQISYAHTRSILPNGTEVVFYDVTTLYFEIDNEDDFRKTGFSKEGRHQHPQIVLGLLVSEGGYPLAYDIFEGNKFEGHTMLPILNGFKSRYALQKLVVVADSGLLSNKNIEELESEGYKFIIGARVKAEVQQIKDAILALELKDGESTILPKEHLRLIVTYSATRAKKDRHNREKGIKRLEKLVKSGNLNKSVINNRGYNKFLKMEGDVSLQIDQEKLEQDRKWDGIKGYLTNSELSKDDVLKNYQQLWQIEKAFRVAKTDLKIRPVYHYKRRRIEAHICLNFVAYKVYKELERQLKVKKSGISPEKVIEIIQNIYEISVITPQNEVITQLLILSEQQREIQKLFNF